jgi:hypothetical protein
MHSQECLSFLPRYLHQVPGISQVVSYYERAPRGLDFARAWWTPPLTPSSAMLLEREQIARLGLSPMVSLTITTISKQAYPWVSRPISQIHQFQWNGPSRTRVPCTIFPTTRRAPGWPLWRSTPQCLAKVHCLPSWSQLARVPNVLIAPNHPFWLEEGVAEEDHPLALERLLRECST